MTDLNTLMTLDGALAARVEELAVDLDGERLGPFLPLVPEGVAFRGLSVGVTAENLTVDPGAGAAPRRWPPCPADRGHTAAHGCGGRAVRRR